MIKPSRTDPDRIVANLSLHKAVAHWARYSPDKVAVANEAGSITYAELQKLVAATAAEIADLKLSRQAPVALLVEDKIHFVAGLCAILSLGHVAVLLHPGLERGAIERNLKDSKTRTILLDAGHSGKGGWAGYHNIRVQTASRTQIAHVEARRFMNDICCIIYSSGTTGEPKGIARSDWSMLSEFLGWCIELPLTRNDVFYVGRPIFYTGGLVVAAATLLVGGTVVVPKNPATDTYAELVGKWDVDFAFLLPEQLESVLVQGALRPAGWLPPHTILTMGAPMDPSKKQRVIDLLKCDYVESWGNSEGLGTITAPADVVLRPSSVGRPFLTDDILVVDESGSPVAANKIGRIAGRTDSAMSHYVNLPELDKDVFRGDLLLSEDLGYVDDSGHFFLAGRTSERILRKGRPLFARDIERKIRMHANVTDVAVVPVAAVDGGEAPAAALVLNDGKLAEITIAAVQDGLEELERLEQVKIVVQMPRNAAGKIITAEVKRLFVSKQSVEPADNPSNPKLTEPPMNTCLLVIDAQKVYTERKSELYCKDADKTLERVNALIDAFSKAKRPIVYIRHVHQEDGSDLGRMFDYTGEPASDFNFKSRDAEVEFSTGLRLEPKAPQIVKHRYSAFQGTDLQEKLRALKVDTVVVCGFMTNFCCDSTAREAHDRDYYVDFILDATGTPGTEKLNQSELRKAVGEMLGAGYARVVMAKRYIAGMQT
jgi:acyl-coenzyme A synthetase/AMP-(fatty) acid ligase/nicotinamidase-related amidase